MSVLSVVVTIIILGLLIFVHELGHFLAAKLVGIKVHEFALGMGPLVYSKRVGETQYSLRALPIGGYNRMAGMDPEEEYDPRGFNTRTVGQRMGVIAAGSIMNFLLAIVLFAVFFMGIGVASNRNEIGEVLAGSPAAQAGLQEGDRIVAVNGTDTPTWEDLVRVIRAHPDEEIQLTVQRGKAEFSVTVMTVRDEQENVGLIGIKGVVEKKGFFESIWLGISSSVALIVIIVQQLFLMIGGQVPADVAGPVGMVSIVGQAVHFGIGTLIRFAALLSLNLGIINLLPIPALDGSRLVFLAIEGIRGRPVNPAKENFIHFIGFVVLLGLMVLITYQDLWRLFTD
ncbi:MAG TPA: RIP metalloprotease RseP [Clostridia bacterium]|nr:RIP metalloprotease RseP [Clostridia bacterium]